MAKQMILEALCPSCGPRRYWVYDDTGERVDIPGPMELMRGLALNAQCACGEQIAIVTEPIEQEPRDG